MLAFAAPLCLQVKRVRSSALSVSDYRLPTTCGQSSDDDATLSLETLPSFEAFCWRTQESLCEQTAAADGLGTFEAPNSFPASQCTKRFRQRAMRGGRAFASASVDVFRSRGGRRTRTRRLITTAGPAAAAAPTDRESVGITLNLRPRDPTLPSLRAGFHYFQIGGGRVSWWFTGSADVCLSHECGQRLFTRSTRRFLDAWSNLCARYRAQDDEPTKAFLSGCLDSSPRFVDRDNSFRFVSDVVDQLLPAYLPLLSNRGVSDDATDDWSHPLPDVFSAIDPSSAWTERLSVESLAGEEIDYFSLSGGASCESATVCASPLGSWRFSLFPSTLTAAGKMYLSLRDSTAHPIQSFLYI